MVKFTTTKRKYPSVIVICTQKLVTTTGDIKICSGLQAVQWIYVTRGNGNCTKCGRRLARYVHAEHVMMTSTNDDVMAEKCTSYTAVKSQLLSISVETHTHPFNSPFSGTGLPG